MAILVSFDTGSLGPLPQQVDSGLSYAEYDRLTRAFVDNSGRVNYAGLKKELRALELFIDQLASTSPDSKPGLFPDEGECKRYYLTAYNAYILYHLACGYPDRNVLWSSLGWFKNREIVLGGNRLTLNDLEHGLIRRRFHDPRAHFYLCCGAVSCAPMTRGAIRPGAVEAALEVAALRLINDRAYVSLDRSVNTLYLSKMFAWYEPDFLDYLLENRRIERPEIIDYIALYARGELAAALSRFKSRVVVEYFPYDRSLNEQ